MTMLCERFKNATRDELMHHAEKLELQMLVLAALLDGRPGATDVSTRNLRQTEELARAIPPSAQRDEDAEHVAQLELQEVADGAYGDGPARRGAARDELARRRGREEIAVGVVQATAEAVTSPLNGALEIVGAVIFGAGE
jgi:hypothetical protein